MTGKRPRGMAEFQALSGFMTDEAQARGLAYRPAPTDVFISPNAKCGTTWMQQIVHGLRSGGSMAFDEITAVVPWLELAQDMGADVNAPQVAAPRAFKSHLGWDDIPKGGRYIVVLRDPADAMVSLLRFLEGWWFETGSVSVEEFADYYMPGSDDGIWGHLASCWRQRGHEDVLLLGYEHMKRDLPGTVDQVAAFMGGYDAQTRAIATRQAEFGFMKAHETQFDDHPVRQTRDVATGLPPGGVASKVDKSRARVEVPTDMRAAMDARWRETVGQQFGLTSYGDLLKALDAGV